ncbi:type 1 glutamine amidotransferase domain-containing protein [Robertkochia solimangrovi]|uniref:type 1 glutamine amidotransferase domain-containing protein n=1 Tax=Robertkochia solimangrovi TaxID=2213046 RepID=UPI001180C1B7|nr:type 1 glutamine amidotransferase domain-containing protein [Robertkochia solimangrovi]TRZ45212.1 protease [Robertkochia solimangrovi]
MMKRIAILATNGFEEIELTSPQKALLDQGWKAEVVSPQKDTIKSWDHTDWGTTFKVDKPLSQANAKDYDALLLPGGVISPDALRIDEDALIFIRDFFKQHKPVGAICHGPWSLINAGVVDGRTMTSYKSIRKDLENAGALWVDREVVVDEALVTSRNPDDLPAFNKKLVEEIKEGKHTLQQA